MKNGKNSGEFLKREPAKISKRKIKKLYKVIIYRHFINNRCLNRKNV